MQEGDLGPAVEADGRENAAETSIDVHLHGAALEQAAGVFATIARRDNRRTVEWNVYLAAVGVAGQNQMATGLRPMLERVGVVHQHEGQRRVHPGKGARTIRWLVPQVAQTDDRERLAANGNGDGLIAQDGDPGSFDEPCDLAGIVPVIVIAEGSKDAIPRPRAAETLRRFVGEPFRFRIVAVHVAASRSARVTEVIAGENHHVGRQRIGAGDALAQIGGADIPAAMQVCQVGDGQPLPRGRQVGNVDGNVVAGPPPRPLRRLYCQARDGKLFLALEVENLEKALRTHDD